MPRARLPRDIAPSAPAPSTPSRVRFARPGPLQATLRRRAHAALAARGLPRHGGARLLAKALFILALLAAAYIALVFIAETAWQVALAAFLLSQAIVLVGFDVMHDGGHGAFSDKPWLNRLMARGLDLIGGNQTLWRHKHGVLHHGFTNLDRHDDDLEGGALLRMHPDQPWRPWHRYQALYALPLYSLLAVHWVVSDFTEYFGRRVGDHALPPPSKRDVAVFLAFKALWMTLAFLIPMTQHPPLAVLGIWLAVMLVVGFTLALVFQLAHVVDGVAFPTPDEHGRVGDEWVVHQLRTTADFAPHNAFLRWYVGGLNFQVEHHLFSKISHVRYRHLQPVVEATCAELGAPYRCYPTFRAALAAHLRQLRALGRRPEARALPAAEAA